MQLKPTCSEVHRLVSEGQDRNLSVIEKIRVRLHLAVCDACTTFNSQMRFLRHAMRKFEIADDAPTTPPPTRDAE
ncbi:zf-HC2 domain-containing protein [Actimicrobium sp. CCI2.3]|uniref:zf-HC2 domain-containing protein n=1 Tax=Actimicrobium sp. CCI2.3 TaxID=3048616 RepID=UPI002AB4F181|nr:zf-HC2 domain-containing protein [Actimicrobium sp. CCI2.3]MDY7576635.1 zf-HC2 domain-containing protein [Actimicrobium sp. CCI2.3]MEB0021236.1 zf-HC2 domain-containing protein [Actimicrobium sp. CCI2.3]